MDLVIKKVRFHKDEKNVVEINEAQALFLVSNLVTNVLAQNGFSAEIEVK